jgi:peptidoglycan/LPS O-acetylase OafA/YrhL
MAALAQLEKAVVTKRLESLDAIRGAAALCVVVWHWQQLLLLDGPKLTWPPVGGEPTDHSAEPAYVLLKPIYNQGVEAIDLFFVISGFVFFYLYRSSIAVGQTKGLDFFWLRFSRLYPLHFLTLVVVAALQALFVARAGQPWVYDRNDLVHFARNLFFVNVPETTFNGPTWSLSIEIVMYVIFWALARAGALNFRLVTVILGLVGVSVQALAPHADGLVLALARGLAGFFVGAAMFELFAILRRQSSRAKAICRALYVAAVLSWIAAIAVAFAPEDQLTLGGFHIHGVRYLHSYGLFPLTVLVAALWDANGRARIVGFEWLGSISYSSYLLHFPLQLLLALAVVYGIAPRTVYANGVIFAAYFASVLALSTLSYYAFEIPVQRWLRRQMATGAGVHG